MESRLIGNRDVDTTRGELQNFGDRFISSLRERERKSGKDREKERERDRDMCCLPNWFRFEYPDIRAATNFGRTTSAYRFLGAEVAIVVAPVERSRIKPTIEVGPVRDGRTDGRTRAINVFVVRRLFVHLIPACRGNPLLSRAWRRDIILE